MEEIARRAGIGKSTVYEYFPSKLDLLSATGDFFLDQMLLDVERMLYAGNPARQALSDYMEYICSVMGSLGMNIMLLVGDSSVTEIIHRLCKKYLKTTTKNLIRLLREAQESGEISPEVNITMAASLIMTLPNPRFAKMAERDQLRESIDQLINLLFSGLSPR